MGFQVVPKFPSAVHIGYLQLYFESCIVSSNCRGERTGQ